MNRQPALISLFWMFVKIACTSFGGFMAMIAVIENEVVERKKLMSQRDILDGISLASILPGPVAVNVVVFVGYRLRGGSGALISALGAVLPSFAFILVLSLAYFQWGQVPVINKLFMGFIPAVSAIILSAAWNMSRKSITSWREAVIAVAAAVALIMAGGIYSTVMIIACAGLIGAFWLRRDEVNPIIAAAIQTNITGTARTKSKFDMNATFFGAAPLSALPLWQFDPGVLFKLFLVFSGMSLMLFGGGYVFIPMIQEIVVNGHRWVSQQEFVDAIAMGQITPGPILVSAAFIGLKVAGLTGAVVATLGIYLPAALLMAGGTHLLERIQGSRVIVAALCGVRPSVIGMITAAAFSVGWTAPHHWASLLIFVAALTALLRLRIEVVWVIPIAGFAGWALF
ncbi:MAG: chromate efflux transporter [Gammaproteobacteria bacterium]|nr:chromate efflux transporter [Gammaproteobacteria bacterium]